MYKTTAFLGAALALTLAAPLGAGAATPQDIQKGYEAQARQSDPAFKGFSAERGQRFFTTVQGSDWRCSTCHTPNPAAQGRHEVTGKTITPLAPVANPERFTREEKVEKWFKRNCKDVLKRECTPQEKGDVMAWLLALPAGGAR